MKKNIKFLSSVLASVLVFSLLTSCSTSMGQLKKASEKIDNGALLKLPVCNTDSLNPYEAATEYNLALAPLLFEGLVKVNEDFTAKNVIAKSVSVVGNTVNVNLDSSYCFSDGSSILASDIEYSFEQAKISGNFEKQLENFDEISASGHSVTFNLKNPDKYADLCLDFPIVKEPSEDDEYVIGSGKYKIESLNSLIMNELWHSESLPKVRRIKLVNMLDTESGPESVETGTVSYYFQDMSNGTYIRKNVQTHETQMTNLVFLGINSNNEHLKKAEVRQAVSLLMPKETIAEKSFLGYAEVAEIPFFSGWKELENVKFADKTEALNEAKELLESAGYKRSDVLSSVMCLRIIVNDDNSFKISAAQNIADALKSVGISVTVEKLSFQNFVGRLQRGEYELYIGETKLAKNMSLSQFFSYNGGASYGIDTSSKIVDVYNEFLSGKVKLQRFVDYFDVAVPFVPICFRSGIEMYTNEMSVSKYGTVTDRFENIYSWSY